MIPIRTGSFAAVLLLLASAVAPGNAGERLHTVRPGESASAIAKRYYGDYDLGDLVLRYNAKPGTLIQAGERLRIPYCDVHRVEPGDTWSAIAQRYLGKVSVYPVLAALNDLPPDRPLRVGQTLLIPVTLTHRLERGETLMVLAERFYGDASLNGVIREFNEVADPRRLSVGQAIDVPLVSLRLDPPLARAAPGTESKTPPTPLPKKAEPRELSARAAEPSRPTGETDGPDPASRVVVATSSPEDAKGRKSATRAAAEPARPAPERPRYSHELVAARKAFETGDYARARRRLESLRQPVVADGTEAERIELWRLLSFVYVAFDQTDDACVAHRSLRRLSEEKWNPDLVSPKIRNTLAGCGPS